MAHVKTFLGKTQDGTPGPTIKNLCKYWADTEAEISSIPIGSDVAAGSTAVAIDTATVYVIAPARTWKKVGA